MKSLVLAAVCAFSSLGAEESDGFVPLFNGKDLSGWVNANCAPETWSVTNGMIHCTGFPTGAMRTARQYENFILEAEWRHLSSGGNSGIFIWGTPIAAPGVPFLRGIEVQVLDHGFDIPGKNQWYTTHGDVFPIHGARMKPFGRHNGDRSFPSEERSKGFPEWNHYRIVCDNGVLRLSVNGKEVSGGEECNYRKGYLALESEGGPVEFRNLRIKELPARNPSPDLCAPVDEGFRAIFTGLDLRGWRTNAAVAGRWAVEGERLRLKSGAEVEGADLLTTKDYSGVELVLDVAPDSKDGKPPAVRIHSVLVSLEGAPVGKFTRFRLKADGRQISIRRNDEPAQEIPVASNSPAAAPIGLSNSGGPATFFNLYVREIK